MKQLEKIGQPVNGTYQSVDDLVKQRTYLTKIGGVTYKKNARLINMNYLLSSHFNVKDRLNFFKGFSFTSTNMWAELNTYNLHESITRLSVPVYFVMGRHDRIVHDEVKLFYQNIDAPKKKLMIFENSGHMACFEEPALFNHFMIHDVLKSSLYENRN